MIGAGINRTEGPLKVAGRAAYSAERRDAGATLHGFVLGAALGNGRIARIDTAAAQAAPGVHLVMTYQNAPRQGTKPAKAEMFDPRPELVSERITRYGQPVALVVAEGFEQARAAAALIDIAYETSPGAYDLAAEAGSPKDESRLGDIEAAMGASDVTIEATYTTPYHMGLPMELHACVADWRDGQLTVYLTAQMLKFTVEALADTLLLDRSQVLVDSAYIGGGFGSKIALHSEAVLASLGAMALGRPVKLVMTRRQIFTLVGHRAASISHIRLAATRDGRLTAIGHDAIVQTSADDKWSEGVAGVSRALYAAPNRLTRHTHTTLDVGAAEPVRGPGEVPGLLVFESAMDEMAEKLGMDPVEFRLRNDTLTDPEKGVPLSGRRLAECFREGAKRFGWDDRPRSPASRREGDWLIGYGTASSMRGHPQTPVEVRVRIEPEGIVVVQSDMTDLGTGTYTIMAQVAAAALNIGVEQIRVELARTNLPKSFGSGGSWGAGNMSVATDRACQTLREEIGAVAEPGYNDLFAEVRRHFPQGIEAIGKNGGNEDDHKNNSIYTYGATFVEVGVDAYTAEVRVRRMTGVFACGHVLNAKTARSQMIGGMIWGVGAALHEGAYVDPRNGAWVNSDLAEYLIPAHADIPDIDIVLLDDFDGKANHMGVKGIGELGSGGTASSVANAVYNATGVRVRDFPITVAKLLEGMPRL